MAVDVFQLGSVEMLTLYMLRDGDAHGYQLVQMLEAYSDGLLTVKTASLYPILYKLEANGFITGREAFVERKSTMRPGRSARIRVMYHIEPAGLERLEALLAEHETFFKGCNAAFTHKERNGDGE